MTQNKIFYKFVGLILKPFVKLIFPYEIYGAENLSIIKTGCLLCSNHLSNMDAIFLIVGLKNTICFMAKEELFKNKLLGCILSMLGVFPVKRGKRDISALDISKNIIKNDDILGIFIEGTRSKTGEFLRPKSGAAFLAYSCNAPVIPVCITGGGKNNKVKAFKKTLIKISPGIFPKDFGIVAGTRSEIKSATNMIMEKIKEMRN